MIVGAHFLLYSTKPEEDRAFLRDVLKFPAVDIGQGWLIFALPPAEAAVHPSSGEFAQDHAGRKMMGAVLYLMCTNLREVIQSLEAKNVKCSAVSREVWGIKTTIPLPSGVEIGLYQPTHPTALDLNSK